ncbi:hypothetical protein [Deinococcus piscis]|nr:hypothetical protein [Deinococcus piscis]
MQHISNWTDLYGAVHASFEGRSGGHRWLVALPAEAAEHALDTALAALGQLDGKGRADLVVFSDPAAVSAAAHELNVRGVLVLESAADTQWAGLPLRVSAAADTQAALERWLDEVPHGR